MKNAKTILLGLSLVLGGCSFLVRLDPNPIPYIREKIDLSVGLFVDESQIKQIHSQGGFCLIGMGHTWDVETGMALRVGAERIFRRVFTNIGILQEVSEFTNKPLTLLITPRIERFNISQDLAAELYLHCKLIDQIGKVVYENTIYSKGGSQAATGCLLGVWGGQMALSETSNEVFNKAFAFLANDITNNSPSQNSE